MALPAILFLVAPSAFADVAGGSYTTPSGYSSGSYTTPSGYSSGSYTTPGGTDADTDSDTDSDTDADTDADSDTDGGTTGSETGDTGGGKSTSCGGCSTSSSPIGAAGALLALGAIARRRRS